jgi:hypothetical protein
MNTMAAVSGMRPFHDRGGLRALDGDEGAVLQALDADLAGELGVDDGEVVVLAGAVDDDEQAVLGRAVGGDRAAGHQVVDDPAGPC